MTGLYPIIRRKRKPLVPTEYRLPLAPRDFAPQASVPADRENLRAPTSAMDGANTVLAGLFKPVSAKENVKCETGTVEPAIIGTETRPGVAPDRVSLVVSQKGTHASAARHTIPQAVHDCPLQGVPGESEVKEPEVENSESWPNRLVVGGLVGFCSPDFT